ncbi:MAG: hypothetical protein LBI96_06495 [Odoribacteraceae bacterium]|nr:hypothetical protein [Odoribacteraceae bacterium]
MRPRFPAGYGARACRQRTRDARGRWFAGVLAAVCIDGRRFTGRAEFDLKF